MLPDGNNAAVNWVKGALGMMPPPASRDPVNIALDTLQNRLSVRRAERTFVIDVSVQSRDPEKAAQIANAIGDAYFAEEAAARTDTARRASDALAGRPQQPEARCRAGRGRRRALPRGPQARGLQRPAAHRPAARRPQPAARHGLDQDRGGEVAPRPGAPDALVGSQHRPAGDAAIPRDAGPASAIRHALPQHRRTRHPSRRASSGDGRAICPAARPSAPDPAREGADHRDDPEGLRPRRRQRGGDPVQSRPGEDRDRDQRPGLCRPARAGADARCPPRRLRGLSEAGPRGERAGAAEHHQRPDHLGGHARAPADLPALARRSSSPSPWSSACFSAAASPWRSAPTATAAAPCAPPPVPPRASGPPMRDLGNVGFDLDARIHPAARCAHAAARPLGTERRAGGRPSSCSACASTPATAAAMVAAVAARQDDGAAHDRDRQRRPHRPAQRECRLPRGLCPGRRQDAGRDATGLAGADGVPPAGASRHRRTTCWPASWPTRHAFARRVFFVSSRQDAADALADRLQAAGLPGGSVASACRPSASRTDPRLQPRPGGADPGPRHDAAGHGRRAPEIRDLGRPACCGAGQPDGALRRRRAQRRGRMHGARAGLACSASASNGSSGSCRRRAGCSAGTSSNPGASSASRPGIGLPRWSAGSARFGEQVRSAQLQREQQRQRLHVGERSPRGP